MPAITEAYGKAVSYKQHDPEKDRVFDFGAGPGYLSRTIMREGGAVDLIDTSPKMLEIAKQTIAQARFQFPVTEPRFVSDCTLLDQEAYGFGMMNFVVQNAPTRNTLCDMFANAARLLRKPGEDRMMGGALVLTQTHLDWLHISHSAYAFDLERMPCKTEGYKYLDKRAKQPVREGDSYSGIIRDDDGKAAFQLEGDHLWKRDTIIEIAEKSGLAFKTLTDIDDKPSSARRASEQPAYMMFTFERIDPGPEEPQNA